MTSSISFWGGTASLNDLPRPGARYEEGIADYARLDSQALANIRAAFDSLTSGLIDRTFKAFGDFFASSSLDLRTRQLATCGALAAAANAAPQLQFHVGVSLALGVEKDALVAVLEEVQVHAGIPAAYNGLVALKAMLAPATATAEPVYR